MEKDWVEIVVQRGLFRVGGAGEICSLGGKAVDFSWTGHDLNFFSLWGLSVFIAKKVFLLYVTKVIELLEVKFVFLSL